MVDTDDPKSPLQQQHAVLVWSSPTCVMEGALQLRIENDVEDKSILSSTSVGSGSGSGELVDMCWSDRDARHVLSAHKNGTIVLWDLKRKEKFSGSGGGIGIDSSDDDADDEDEDID